MIRGILLFLLCPLLGYPQINAVLQDWKNDKDLKNASIGFSVHDAKTSSVIAEYNSHLALIPASTLKIVTTSAALGILGKNFRHETKIYYTGTFDKSSGTLDGDIIIYGKGDPTLASEYFERGDSIDIAGWATSLSKSGLKRVKGRIIGDASYFDHALPDSWNWGDIGNYFGAAACGLSILDNKFKIQYSTRESGSKANLTNIYPQYFTQTLTVNSNVTAGGTTDNAIVYGDPFSFSKVVNGEIPPNQDNYTVEASLPDPALMCAEMFYKALTKKGIVCDQKSIESNYTKRALPADTFARLTNQGYQLDQIVYYTNLKSDNLYCETLLRTLGKGDPAAGGDAVKKYWQQRGLDVSELFMSDASGLSRANTITSHFQSALLCKIYRDSLIFGAFYKSLPIAGKSGSMSKIGKNKLIENNMRAKTGYINRVRAYCGYVKCRSGKNLAFSVIFNNYNCNAKDAKLKMEKFLVALGEL